MIFWVFLAIFVNGIISFAYSVKTVPETTNLWAMLAVNFVYFLGITQTGIIFSAVMRLARSEWARYFSRLGEVLTLSFIPVAAVTFAVIYIGGINHLFFWASPNAHGEHINPLFGRNIFLWKNMILMALFYIISYAYFRSGREEASPSESSRSGSNALATLVIITYVIANTNIAWDFGMMISPHWESSIFPPYYWSGNLLVGSAFLFLISVYFISGSAQEGMGRKLLDSMGKVLLGFMLLWVYMLWSQYIVIWYGNQPDLTGHLYKEMTGNYALMFAAMILTGLVIPFFGLIFRRIKLDVKALSAVAVSICVAMWLERYLMIIPAISDGNTAIFASWAGVSLTLAGLSSILLSIMAFMKLFPMVKIKAEREK